MGHIMSIPKNIFADARLQLLIQKYSPISSVYASQVWGNGVIIKN